MKSGGRRPKPRVAIVNLATHDRPYVTVRALAACLETDPRTILRLISEKKLAAVKVNREWRIPTDAARRMFHVETHRHAS